MFITREREKRGDVEKENTERASQERERERESDRSTLLDLDTGISVLLVSKRSERSDKRRYIKDINLGKAFSTRRTRGVVFFLGKKGFILLLVQTEVAHVVVGEEVHVFNLTDKTGSSHIVGDMDITVLSEVTVGTTSIMDRDNDCLGISGLGAATVGVGVTTVHGGVELVVTVAVSTKQTLSLHTTGRALDLGVRCCSYAKEREGGESV